MEWMPTSLSNLESLQKCALSGDFFANNYSAVNSVLYEKKFHSLIAVDDGWIFEKFFDEGKTHYSFPHAIDGNTSDIKSAVQKIVKDGKQAEKEISFSNITLSEKDSLLEIFPSAKITPTPESGDYIYRTENLSNLAGKKLSRKRNHIHQFQNKFPDFHFELLSEKNLSSVREIEEKWLDENLEDAKSNGTVSDLQVEKEIIFFALENFSLFSKICGMSGGLLFAEGNPVAFCISSILSRNVSDVHFEKSISSYAKDGAYAVINNEFSKSVTTEFINREEDLGIEGLRRAKLSYYPEMVLEKFSVEPGDV